MIDKKTCGILFEKYHDIVYNICRKYLKNPNSAEDCTQEVFLIMLKKKNKINLSENLSSWLIETAKRVCKKYISKNSTNFVGIDNFAEIISDDNAYVEKPLSEEIYEILDKEDADLLFEYINADHGRRQEIAERMGVKTTALYQRIKRLREKVLNHLNKE